MSTTTTSSSSRRSKSRPPKVFQCSGYGNCHMTFTRSEHLARHIRKHTGERPFRCHCNRTFSRLDNLRQHAHTVHANEAIVPTTTPLGIVHQPVSAPTTPMSAPVPGYPSQQHILPGQLRAVAPAPAPAPAPALGPAQHPQPLEPRDTLPPPPPPPPSSFTLPTPSRFRPNQHRPGPLILHPHTNESGQLTPQMPQSGPGSPPVSPASAQLLPPTSARSAAHTPTSPLFPLLSPVSRPGPGGGRLHSYAPPSAPSSSFSDAYSPAAPRFPPAVTSFTPPSSATAPPPSYDPDYYYYRQEYGRSNLMPEPGEEDEERGRRRTWGPAVGHHGINLPPPVPSQGYAVPVPVKPSYPAQPPQPQPQQQQVIHDRRAPPPPDYTTYAYDYHQPPMQNYSYTTSQHPPLNGYQDSIRHQPSMSSGSEASVSSTGSEPYYVARRRSSLPDVLPAPNVHQDRPVLPPMRTNSTTGNDRASDKPGNGDMKGMNALLEAASMAGLAA
ncbi:hypothetical protein V1525DRAFT_401601 [Lipomyces kononenkoae]|uniref:Uncharacterized protein n=1 Tax=Lipomyces kononenkoae TaxID=34357 RepID=A0ACC3T3G8_LIPKO